jgi:gliding motility associated protien GldN
MKRRLFQICIVSAIAVLFTTDSLAQGRGGRRRDQPADTSKRNQQPQQVTNVNAAPPYNPYGNIPIEVDSAGMIDNEGKKSLRPENAFDKGNLQDRNPLPYEHIRWDDAFYAEKVWRELDLREKLNLPFRYEAQDDNGSQMFVDILLKAVRSGKVTAFFDDRFTTPLSVDEVNGTVSGTNDTIPVTDPNDFTKIIKYKVTKASFDPKSVNKLLIKEEWVFDRESSRLVCRILGIAPLLTKFLPNGQEFGQSIMFWVHYPDMRPTLAKYEVYNPKNMGQSRMTWEELFESRMFSSYITKSTLDNPTFKPLRALMNQNQILSLLEGDNIRDKIFNFEQNLWSY